MLNNEFPTRSQFSYRGDDFCEKLRLACSGLLLLFFSLPVPAWHGAEVTGGSGGRVTGNHQVAETILRAVSNIRLGEVLDENAVRKDLQAIKTLVILVWSMRMWPLS